MIPQPQIVPSDPEIIGFEIEGEQKWIRLKLKDGTVLEFKTEVTAVVKIGNDVNTGMPIYNVQSTGILRTIKVPKELIKKPTTKPTTMYQ